MTPDPCWPSRDQYKDGDHSQWPLTMCQVTGADHTTVHGLHFNDIFTPTHSSNMLVTISGDSDNSADICHCHSQKQESCSGPRPHVTMKLKLFLPVSSGMWRHILDIHSNLCCITPQHNTTVSFIHLSLSTVLCSVPTLLYTTLKLFWMTAQYYLWPLKIFSDLAHN